MGAVLGWALKLLSNPYVAMALAAVAGAWAIHDHGVKQERRKWEIKMEVAQAERRQKIAEYVVQMSAREVAALEQLRLERGRIKTETQTILKEVTTYVTQIADRRCDLTLGFVELHDGAATGRLPAPGAPAGGLVDQSAGIPLSVAGAAISKNYGACRDNAAEVRAWREWYPRYVEAYKAFAGATPGKSQAVPPTTKGR